jgi:integrase/recombinase XerD
MLERFFRRRHVVARLRAGPCGQLLEKFAAYLHDLGYAPWSAQGYLWAAEHFSGWIAAQHLSFAKVDEGLIRSFVRDHLPRRGKHPSLKPSNTAHAGLRHWLRMLRLCGIVPAPTTRPGSFIGGLVAEYDQYLEHVHGLTPATRLYRTRYVRAFLSGVFGDQLLCWKRLQPQDVHDFVAGFGRSGRLAAAAVAACSLRSFLRWLQLLSHCPANLLLAVPRFRRWRHAGLPKVMTEDQVRSFLDGFDRSTAVGRRDYALALCQMELGLRVSEVANLALADLDWRQGTLSIPTSKSRRGRVLPLSKRVGQAISDYLRRGRPETSCRCLFVRHTVPVGTSVSRELVRGVIRRAYARVEGCAAWTGTHVLRRTAATRMHRGGATLKEVAGVLGHRCLDTTALYAKVDRERLATVALPWPEEGQP